ncbi:unnamed protein product [Nyctereutes procyonoides]|uniref:(raccoon dog) hypothetical protein n=1 Tax=Nyctereutes procyonoides TaxID=34880 RepID=A0A811XX33_NYCPR|nr:unnamed protein product [Nyctereutes procyonoides]
MVSWTSATASDSTRRVSVCGTLLVKEAVHFPDPNKIHCFQLTATPEECSYLGGKFQLETEVPDAYNMGTPKDVVWGLSSLDKEDFGNKVEDYIRCYAR